MVWEIGLEVRAERSRFWKFRSWEIRGLILVEVDSERF